MKAISHCLFLAVLICFGGCPAPLTGEPPPEDRAYFPSHLVQNEKQLFIFSYNQDLRYASGSILKLDLDNANAVLSFSPIPSFAEAPVLLQDSKILFLSRSSDEMYQFDIKKNKTEKIEFDKTADPKGKVRNWLWHDPYYLSMLSTEGDEIKGLIGYLNDRVSIEKIEDIQNSRLEHYGELEVFSLEKNSLKINHTYLLQDIVPTAPETSTDKKEKLSYRRISHIGGLRILRKGAEQFVLIGADALLTSSNLFSATRQTRLLWFSTQNIETKIDQETVGAHQLPAERIVGFDIIEVTNQHQIYAIMENPNLLVRVDLTRKGNSFEAKTKSQVPLCEKPSDIKIAPNKKTLLVSCAKNDEILAFNTSDLMLVARDSDTAVPFGRGPVRILFDSAPGNQRAFVSYSLDGSIGIFEIDDNLVNKNRLKTIGRIFEQGPHNHSGGK